MATKKIITINTDGTRSVYSGIATSAGAGSADDLPRLDGAGRLDVTFMPVGFGQDAVTATAGEALAGGDFVYFNGAGDVLKADATAIGKQARGYVNVSVLNGGTATIFFDDNNTGLTGLTPGLTYYLSAIAGLATTTAPTAVGQIVQPLGFASSATNLRVSIEDAVTL